MSVRIHFYTVLSVCAYFVAAPEAGAQARQATERSAASMSFFVTSRGVNGSANLGGLAGADRHCQHLAAAVGAGNRTWRAFLSTAPEGAQSGVDARDRIGQGPWQNIKGVVVARNLAELFSDGNRIDRFTSLTETGQTVQQHDVLTGTDDGGRLAFSDQGVPATCSNWIHDGEGVARIGHSDSFDASSWGNKRFNRWQGSWRSEHFTNGCSAKQLSETGGAGQFYCFAADSRPVKSAAAPVQDARAFTFKRGLNINHWLGNNLSEEDWPNSLYGADWFNEEDIAWIAGQGFDHLRISVGGHYWIDKRGDLDAAALAPFDNALRWAKQHGLGVVLSMVSLPGFRAHLQGKPPAEDESSPFTDDATRGDAAYLWWLVARRFADEGKALRFELLAAPHDATVEQMNAFNRLSLAAIRKTNPQRVVYVTSADMSIDSIDAAEPTDPNVALSVRFWEPRAFSFQVDPQRPQVKFPGKVPDLRRFYKQDDPGRFIAGMQLSAALIDTRIRTFAERIASWADSREVYVNSFGVYETADDQSARNYLGALRQAFERHGLSWAVYDYQTRCAVRDKDGNPTRVLEGLGMTTYTSP